jgi:molybdate transport system substrate-binding protein
MRESGLLLFGNLGKVGKILTVLTLFSIIIGCSNKADENTKKKELLIYCGITMIKPITEIASLIEKRENCKITITKGGSGNLLKSINFNQTGDLFLPGSDKYYKMIKKDTPDLISETILVGHNRAAIMVQKGNPSHLTSDLNQLTDKKLGVVIGNPDSGSIGKTTKEILTKRGIFQDVVLNALTLTTDSKDMIKALKLKEADLVINWYAVSTWDNNPEFIDVIEIEPEFRMTKKLILGLLKYSDEPDLARKFMVLAGGEDGRKIFRKHGLYMDNLDAH